MTTIKIGIDKVSTAIGNPVSTTKIERGKKAETTSSSNNPTSFLSTRHEDEKTALYLGNELHSSEELYKEALRADPQNAKDLIKKIADKLGIPVSKRDSLTLDGLKTELQMRYQRNMQDLEGFMQLMKNRFDIFRNLLNKLDVR